LYFLSGGQFGKRRFRIAYLSWAKGAVMGEYTIVPMRTDEEISGKAFVHFQSWHETYEGLVDGEYMKTVTLERCEQIARAWRDNLLVAKDGNKVIGFAGYGRYRDETMAEYGEIFALYVLRAYQGRKVGIALMNEAVERLAAHPAICLWVLKGNEKAIRFYEKYGFRFDGTEQEILLGTPCIEQRMVLQRF
jgi:ribosomal protein S18 acetylase RimI-like enzyme